MPENTPSDPQAAARGLTPHRLLMEFSEAVGELVVADTKQERDAAAERTDLYRAELLRRLTAPDAPAARPAGDRVTISRPTVDAALRWGDAIPATDGSWTAEDRVAYGELLGVALATPAPDRTTPSDPQAAARDAIAVELARYENSDMPEWAYEPVTTFADRAEAIIAALAAAGLVITAPDAPSGTVCISREAKEILDHILYKHGDTYAFLEPLRDAIAAAEGEPGERGEGDSA